MIANYAFTKNQDSSYDNQLSAYENYRQTKKNNLNRLREKHVERN